MWPESATRGRDERHDDDDDQRVDCEKRRRLDHQPPSACVARWVTPVSVLAVNLGHPLASLSSNQLCLPPPPALVHANSLPPAYTTVNARSLTRADSAHCLPANVTPPYAMLCHFSPNALCNLPVATPRILCCCAQPTHLSCNPALVPSLPALLWLASAV
jgi:hypothetical protein